MKHSRNTSNYLLYKQSCSIRYNSISFRLLKVQYKYSGHSYQPGSQGIILGPPPPPTNKFLFQVRNRIVVTFLSHINSYLSIRFPIEHYYNSNSCYHTFYDLTFKISLKYIIILIIYCTALVENFLSSHIPLWFLIGLLI